MLRYGICRLHHRQTPVIVVRRTVVFSELAYARTHGVDDDKAQRSVVNRKQRLTSALDSTTTHVGESLAAQGLYDAQSLSYHMMSRSEHNAVRLAATERGSI